MKVMKFGGGCLKDGRHFLRAGRIIMEERDKTAVVVSARGGITDLLDEGILSAVKSEEAVPGIIKDIKDIHARTITKAVRAKTVLRTLEADMEARLKRLERLYFGISYTEEVTESLRALILSHGERLAALILAAVLFAEGRPAVAMEADRIGIVTDGVFENATAQLPEIKKNFANTVLPVLNNGVIPVITGFFGRSPDGKTTTFGRNGSDYSAAITASALDSASLEIWKDVDGFLSADPKIIPTAERIDSLSYYEAAELSYFGANILYPRTIEPLIEHGMPLRIRNIYEPSSSGTLIFNGSSESKGVVKSISANSNIAVIKIRGPGVGVKPGIIAAVGKVLSDLGINIYSVITSQTCINLLLDKNDAGRSHRALQNLAGGVIKKIQTDLDIALIAVVGHGLLKRQGVAARVFTAVAREKINILMTSSGASEVAYYFIIRKPDLEAAVKAVHREFFKS